MPKRFPDASPFRVLNDIDLQSGSPATKRRHQTAPTSRTRSILGEENINRSPNQTFSTALGKASPAAKPNIIRSSPFNGLQTQIDNSAPNFPQTQQQLAINHTLPQSDESPLVHLPQQIQRRAALNANDNNEEPNALDEFTTQNVLAVYLEKHVLGVAIFDPATLNLHSGQINVTRNDLDYVLGVIKRQARPSTIVTNSAVQNETEFGLLQMLKQSLHGGVDDEFPVLFVRKSAFNLEGAIKKIELLSLAKKPAHFPVLQRGQSRAFMASMVNFEDLTMVRAIGGLLHFMQAQGIVNQFEPNCAPIRIREILQLQIEDFLHIDSMTLQAMDILKTESHPSVVKGGGGQKEGFSLYGLLDRCSSKIGACFVLIAVC
jgi:hypothetical protein